MESLIGYGSEDDFDEPTNKKKGSCRQADANYEEVLMDLSEDSSNSPKYDPQPPSRSKSTGDRADRSSRASDENKSKYNQERHEKSRSKYRNESDRSRHRDYKSDRNYEKGRRRDERSYRRRDSRDSEDRNKDSSRDSKKYSRDSDSRDNSSRVGKSYDSRESSSQDSRRNDSRDSRNDFRSKKSPSRHRSRSPAYSDNRSKRSSSREKNRYGYSSKYDRNASKMDRIEKLGIEFGSTSDRGSTSNSFQDDKESDKNRFFMPGITGRFTEQIQRRKMLWQKKDDKPAETAKQLQPVGVPGKVWQNTTFAQDTDGKVANKFKRLMGIKGSGDNQTAKPATEILKKQEEMFSSMEAQYEVARTATHTMRGVGLGFSSFQR